MNEIQISVNKEIFKASTSDNLSDPIQLNGKDYSIELLRNHGNNVKTYLINNKVVTIQADEKDDGGFKILHNNFEYLAEIKTETTVMLEKFMINTGSALGEGQIKAPMPGLIVKINFAVGDVVNEGDKVIIIEAMKMENALATNVSGKIKAIKVNEGDAVEKGKILLEIDTEE
ncbi:acetyl-CoA carboxylase biotin carboxyl carrier protein subunit [Candidatus Kapabacteria bacterium]|nr:acetyl-CoA carboxylase biotin carboxyl carrier protein subunit [Candidatus Kapabacteria bacterium]